MPYAIGNFAGVDLTTPTSTASFTPGTVVDLSDGGKATYVRAISEVSTFAAVGIYADNTAQMLTTTTSATTKRVAFAQVSIASGYYGWVQTGTVKINLAANCDDNVPLYTTATSGVLDDAVVSGGLVGGVTSTVTISNATAVTCIAAAGAIIITGDAD